MPRRLLACLVGTALLVGVLPGRARADDAPARYEPPVDAAVVDPFRPPETPYGSGNRGLLYGTEPGAVVHAAADGIVRFAGSVAGARHVTIEHGDGLRTTYSYLDEVAVVVGQRLSRGDRVGTTTGQLHLGARAGDAYLDPASLFEGGPPEVHLVPFDIPLAGGEAGERSAIRQLIGGVAGLAGDLAEAVGDKVLLGTGATVDWLRTEGPQLLRTALHYAERSMPGIAQLHMAWSAYDAWTRARRASSRECTAPEAAVAAPGGRRVAILVGGLGSTSESAAIDDVDTAALGYDEGDVLRYSYAGGRTPDPTDHFDHLSSSAYGKADTQRDLRGAAADLADLLEELSAGFPMPIDLYAHSQGGVVVRLALIELEARHGRAWLDRLGLVATLATPHGGADLATAIDGFGSTQLGSKALDLGGLAMGLDDDAPSAAQLAETSDVVAELNDTPIPDNVDAVTIAARGDVVVPVPRARARGATEVVVPVSGLTAHDALPGSSAATRELTLALAGRPPGCESFRDALLDQGSGYAISAVEDSLGAMAWVGAAWRGMPFGG